jgi:hypothetical protein
MDVALEVPLTFVPLGGLAQRNNPGTARVKVLGEPLDGAAFAGRVSTLEHDHHPLACFGHPVLQFELTGPAIAGQLLVKAVWVTGAYLLLLEGVRRVVPRQRQHARHPSRHARR